MINKEQTVWSCVAVNFATAEVFKKHKIDFCCWWEISIEEACKKQNIDLNSLLSELNDVSNNKKEETLYDYLELDKLADYIVNNHHSYVRKNLPIIEPYLDKIVEVHSENHPELFEVQKNFRAVRDELLSHIQKEENVLFPFIKKMVEAKNTKSALENPPFGTIKNPITQMEAEHDNAWDALKNIRNVTNDLTPPQDACNTYKLTFELLAEFEEDLHKHVHLENNILFPKAIILEEELRK